MYIIIAIVLINKVLISNEELDDGLDGGMVKIF